MNNNTGQTAFISNLQHFSTGDGPGIRSTIFFQGCNLKCAWCHNPETIPRNPVLLYYRQHCTNCRLCVKACPNSAHEDRDGHHAFNRSRCRTSGQCVISCPSDALKLSGTLKTLQEVLDYIYEDIDFYKASGGGVTLSGGEPMLQADFCAAVAKNCKEKGISVIIDTAGNVNYSEFEKVIPFTDTFYYDLKGATEEDYRDKTGGSFQLTVTNMTRLVTGGAEVIARIPIIPGYNDNPVYCGRLNEILKKSGVKGVHLLPFHRLGSSKYDAIGTYYSYFDTSPPSKEKMNSLLEIFREDFETVIEWT